MDHAQQELEDMEGDFEKKLEQEKVNNVEKEKEHQEKQKKENKREPHLVNLNEDPQLSQHIYYGFKEELPVKVGRKTDNPLPKIIFGGVSVTSNHGQFSMLDNGLIQFEINVSSAFDQTLINGKKLPSDHKQILNHLDTIYFGSGAMLLFKYPLLKQKVTKFTEDIKTETAGDDQEDDLAEDEINILVMSRVMEHGLFDPEDEEKVTECVDYTEEDIQSDMQAIDWEGAYIEVERMEEKKRAAQLEAILKQERLKAEQQYELRQQEETEKNENMRQVLLEKQRQIEEAQKEREQELQKRETETRKQLEDQLQAKEELLKHTQSEQEKVRFQMEKEAIIKQQLENKLHQEKSAQNEEAERIKFEMANKSIELEMIKKQMQQEQERFAKKMIEQKKQYESKLKGDQQLEQIRQKMKNIKKDIDEANEIAKFMNKEVQFYHIYVSKFDDQGIYGGGSGVSPVDLNETQTEVQVKMENFDSGMIHIWSTEKFQDKLVMMRDSLQIYENNEFKDLHPSEDPFYEEQEPILLG